MIVLLVSRYTQKSIPLSSDLIDFLYYLESFSIGNLHKVYKAFSHLVFTAQNFTWSFGAPTMNNVLLIMRKQLHNPLDTKDDLCPYICHLILSHLRI